MPTLQETHHAIVTDNVDPQQRGRLKVRCQSLVSVDAELPDWVEPDTQLFVSMAGSGALFMPAIGSSVELTADVHDTEFDEMPGERFLQNPAFKWRAATFSDKSGPMPLPTVLLTNYPHRRGWVTPAGHIVVMDDKGSFFIQSKAGSKLELADGNIATLSATTVKLGGPSAAEALIKGTTYRGAEDTFLNALASYTTALNVYGAALSALPAMAGPGATFAAAAAAFTAALAAFQASIVTSLSTVVVTS